MADDKKTQLGTLDPSRSTAGTGASAALATSIPSGSPAAPAPPLATPPPGTVGAVATQPSMAPGGDQLPTAPMSATGEDPLIGRTLMGRYAIVRKLGEGGMGSVYHATHVVLEKPVALKILHGEYARKADLVERFIQEAKAASRIRHENVIDISDFGVTEEGLVFFAMEMLSGQDLHEVIARARLDGEVLPWPRSRAIFLQICSALAAAHRHGIVHRDLKPENVYLIEFLGRPDFVKLLDFGIAKLAENDGGERKLTRTGMLFGTPEYMSPEQARGDKVDHRVDIYAMACILFQLLTGRVPFEADNFMGVLSQHLTEPPPEIPPATLARCGAPPQIAAIVARGLAKSPADRWQTIDELAAALVSLEPEADAPAPVVPAPSGRTRTRWTGSPQIPLAEAEPRRGVAPWVLGGVLALAIGGGALWFFTLRGGAATATEDPAAIAAATPPTADPTAAAPTEGEPAAPTEVDPEPPEPVVPPAPLPATVKITFQLAKGVTLYDADQRVVGQAKRSSTDVEVSLTGSETPIAYVAKATGKRDLELTVIPDRDATVNVALEGPAARGRGTARGSAAAPAPTDPAAGGDAPVTAPTSEPAVDEPKIELKPFEGTPEPPSAETAS
ncbi:MAG: serine/threonine-protein kinase [Kofleriaceae bacterium]